MGRISKIKRDLIMESNRRLLGEQNEKLSDAFVSDMVTNVQGLVPHEVEEGENISDIVRNSRNGGGLHFLDFDPKLNDHIKDPNNIYPGDVLLFMTDPTGRGFKTGKEVDEYIKTLNENAEPINEIIGVTAAAILAYRASAAGKSKRLTKKIHKALKKEDINNKVFVGGNFKQFMGCINSTVDSDGNQIKGSGSKKINKSLVKNSDMFRTKKKTAANDAATQEFKKKFDANIERCGKEYKLSPETQQTIKRIYFAEIEEFQKKAFRI